MNSWPRWLPPEAIGEVVSSDGAEGVAAEDLAEGLPISFEPGGRVTLNLKIKADH